MAAGCIPVVYAHVLLPFRDIIPWKDLVLFLDSCRLDDVIKQLREFLALTDVQQRAEAVSQAYIRWLSFTGGTEMVSSLLHQVARHKMEKTREDRRKFGSPHDVCTNASLLS